MANYDNAEVTDRERLAAENQKAIAAYNAQSTKNQLSQHLGNYDFANRQNRRLADVQLKQNARKTEEDRFQAQRDLQNSAMGIMGSMNQAMNGSTIGNLMRMLGDRADQDNMTYWSQHQVNQNSVENAYDESANQNQVSKNDAAINAEQALRASEADLAANLNNINPSLYDEPGTGEVDLGGAGAFDANRVAENNAKLSGYIMPGNSAQDARKSNPRSQVSGADYFGKLINRFNGR